MKTQALSQMYQWIKGLIYECHDQITIVVKIIQKDQSRAFVLLTINKYGASEKNIQQAQIAKHHIELLCWIMNKYYVRSWPLWLALEVTS